jgi:hypothetical protein
MYIVICTGALHGAQGASVEQVFQQLPHRRSEASSITVAACQRLALQTVTVTAVDERQDDSNPTSGCIQGRLKTINILSY